jgi:hypothetical protein
MSENFPASMFTAKGVQKLHPLQTAGGMQGLRVLAEPDVLRLIVRCSLAALFIRDPIRTTSPLLFQGNKDLTLHPTATTLSCRR